MCGIFASFGNGQSYDIVKKGLISLKHRGPDFSGITQFTNGAIGHNLYSLRKPFTKQPIQSNNTTTVLNGELYSFKNNRILFNDSQYFHKNLPTKINLPSLSYYLLQFDGEFSGLVHQGNFVYLFRDIAGIKPLYYSLQDNHLLCSSEIKSLIPFVSKELNESTANEILNYQYHASDKTLISTINSIEPAQIIQFNLITSQITKHTYYSLKDQVPFDNNYTHIYNLLNQAVCNRAQEKFALTLSGGIDSAIIASLCKRNNLDFVAYTIAFDDAKFDESSNAKAICEYLNIPHKVVKVSDQALISNFEEAVITSEEVCVNTHTAAKMLLFKQIKQDGFQYYLSGEGSDELFIGYDHFNSQLHPTFSPNSFHLGGECNNLPPLFNNKVSILNELRKLYHPKFFHSLDIPSTFQDVYTFWNKNVLSNYILTALTDKLEMHYTLEGRVPFLSTPFIRHMQQFTPLSLSSSNITKPILRNMASKYKLLPQSVINRYKHPFVSHNVLTLNQHLVLKYFSKYLTADHLSLNEKPLNILLSYFILLNYYGIKY